MLPEHFGDVPQHVSNRDGSMLSVLACLQYTHNGVPLDGLGHIKIRHLLVAVELSGARSRQTNQDQWNRCGMPHMSSVFLDIQQVCRYRPVNELDRASSKGYRWRLMGIYINEFEFLHKVTWAITNNTVSIHGEAPIIDNILGCYFSYPMVSSFVNVSRISVHYINERRLATRSLFLFGCCITLSPTNYAVAWHKTVQLPASGLWFQ